MAVADKETRRETRHAHSDGDSPSLVDLMRQLRNDSLALVRQEIALAKTEASEKISRVTRNSIYLAIGGLVAYAGLIILLLAGVTGLYLGLVAAGMTHATSGWVAPLIVGILVVLIGYVLIQKAISTISNEPVVPERTARTLQEDKDWAKGKVKS